VVEVKLPIFVVREWHRHRTQSYNEMSARYVPLPDENYVPSLERCMVVNAANKQANAVQGADVLTHEGVIQWLSALEHAYEVSERAYQFGLQIGVPKELARLSVPVGRYTKMRAQANLRNWLAFLTLRSAPNAQWEIRQFADVVGRIIAKTYPRTWELFVGE
jgi:thymidylate synthase (FAD)